MRMIFDSLTGRTILILLIGAVVIELDIYLVSLLIDTDGGGTAGWLSVLAVIVSGLVFIGWVISHQLIKPLKTLSASAKRFSTELQSQALALKGPREVRAAAETFNDMQLRIEHFVEERMQLIAAISHDLRTPLTRLRLRVDAIENDEQKQKALNDIEEMNAMIHSTLAFIRDDAVTESPVKTDIASLLKTICDNTSDTFGPASYTGPEKCSFQCKPQALKRALSNLIENAVKYGEQAQVRLRCDQDAIYIDVEDRGPGIPVEEMDKVFLPFYRIEKSRNRITGGVGLGLSVSRTIIQSHGGTIRLANKKNDGLVVKVSLPL